MEHDQLFERLRNGTAQMEEWTEAVSHGAVTPIPEGIITVHTTHFCGSVTVIRTAAGLVFIDTAKPYTAAQTLAIQVGGTVPRAWIASSFRSFE